ncbi:hypothetical protein ACVGXO_04105 [Enterobacter hormaechei]
MVSIRPEEPVIIPHLRRTGLQLPFRQRRPDWGRYRPQKGNGLRPLA